MRILKYTGLAILVLLVAAVLALVVTQRVSDGPMEFLQGGSFKTGELVTAPVTDWSFGTDKRVEFELVGYGTSRTAGYLIHEGVPYMTCDLGFMWNRFEGSQRTILHLIYIFKRWHHDAVADGRALLRIEGRLYPVNFTKVEDEGLNEALRRLIEERGREYIAPAELGPAPAEPPNDIWFFRMDHRA